MLEHWERLPDRLAAARSGLETLLRTRAQAMGGAASAAPEAGFRHWGDTPQWYDWHKR